MRLLFVLTICLMSACARHEPVREPTPLPTIEEESDERPQRRPPPQRIFRDSPTAVAFLFGLVMKLLINLFELAVGDMRIDLRCRN